MKELVCAFARTFNPLLTVERLPQVPVFPGCLVAGVWGIEPQRECFGDIPAQPTLTPMSVL